MWSGEGVCDLFGVGVFSCGGVFSIDFMKRVVWFFFEGMKSVGDFGEGVFRVYVGCR